MKTGGVSLGRALAAAGLALALVAPAAAAAGPEGGVYIDVKESEAASAPVVERWKLYGASHALVIGIDDYVAGWPKLNNAVRDARELADELERHGFQVTLKTDSDARELRETLRAFYALRGADPEARLLLWFAGHGHTINGEGFLVPADAPAPSDPLFKIKALHMRDFGGLMRLANAKHVLSVFDSCFSGTIFTARSGAAIANITHKTKQPVRQFITSGDAGQQVRDDGSFRKLFVRAIRGEEQADANGDAYVTGEELGLYLSQRMTNLTGAAQTPRHGRLQDVNYDQGDFVFVLPDGAAAQGTAQPATPPARSDEALFWSTIKDSDSPADYEDYLARFPDGIFAGVAERRIAALTERRQAALPPARDPAPAAAIEEMEAPYRATTRANVRAGPATRFDKTGGLAPGEAVTVTGKVREANWFRIAYGDGKEGFVFGKLIQEEAAYQAEIRRRAEEQRQADERRKAEEDKKAAATAKPAEAPAETAPATERAFTSFEANIDRPGGDYASLRLSRADPLICQKLCSEDQRCLAWTYVAPGYQEDKAVCWLKNVVPQATRQDVCCTSGVAYYRRPAQ